MISAIVAAIVCVQVGNVQDSAMTVTDPKLQHAITYKHLMSPYGAPSSNTAALFCKKCPSPSYRADSLLTGYQLVTLSTGPFTGDAGAVCKHVSMHQSDIAGDLANSADSPGAIMHIDTSTMNNKVQLLVPLRLGTVTPSLAK